MAHTANAEEAVKVVEFAAGDAHGSRNKVVVARGVETRNDLVRLAVVVQDLAAAVLVSAKISFPGRDVTGVDACCIVVVNRVQCGRVPVWIVVDCIAEPVRAV